MNDCWFVAGILSVAKFRGAQMLDVNNPGNRMIRNGTVAGTYDVEIPFNNAPNWNNAIMGVRVTDSEIAYFRENFPTQGLLVLVLEKAYGIYRNNEGNATLYNSTYYNRSSSRKLAEPLFNLDFFTLKVVQPCNDLTGNNYTVSGLWYCVPFLWRISDSDLQTALRALNDPDPMKRYIVNVCLSSHDCVHLPGPLQGHCTARNQYAAPVKLSGWFGGSSRDGVEAGMGFVEWLSFWGSAH
jgi:hypothetical protein